MISPKFPSDYLRAYCESFQVQPCQVINDGAEFAIFDPATGKAYAWHFVHTVEELKEAELHECASDSQSHFTCSRGILWSIHPV